MATSLEQQTLVSTGENSKLQNGSGSRSDSAENLQYDSSGAPVSRTNLIINYLPQNMSQEEVRSLFASLGPVESCKLVRDKITGQSLGYGFVNYVRPEDAQKASSTLNGQRLQNKTIKVSFARPSNEFIKGANLYVSGLPKNMTQPELEGLFASHGIIITSRILCDNVTGLSKGVGFVRFDKRCEAEVAISALNNTVPPGGTEPITVKFANNPAANQQKAAAQVSAAAAAAAAAAAQLGGAAPALAGNPLQAAPGTLDLLSSLWSGGGLTAAQPTACLAGLQNVGTDWVSVNQMLPNQWAALLQAASMGGTSASAGGPMHHAHNKLRYSPLGLTNANPAIAHLSASRLGAPTSVAVSMAGANPAFVPTVSSAGGTSDLLALLQQQQLAAAAAVAAAQQPTAQQTQPSAQDYTGYIATTLPYDLSGIAASQAAAGAPGMNAAASVAGANSIFVNNLPPEMDEGSLWQLVSPFGTVLSVKLMRDAGSTACKGYGFVTMAGDAEAATAAAQLHGTMLAGRQLQFTVNKPLSVAKR